jgi:hypothetical protein
MMMYNRQKAEKLLEMYTKASEKGLTGAEIEVSFLYPKSKFYFSVDGMKYSITLNDLADELEGDGYGKAKDIKDWAQSQYSQ